MKATYAIANFSLTSTWTTTGSSYTTPTTVSATKSIKVSLPVGASVESAYLYVTCGGTIGGARTLRVDSSNLTASRTNAVNMSSKVTGDGSYSFVFRWQDVGRAISDGPHSSAMKFSNISVVVEYSVPSEDEEEVLEGRPFKMEAPENAITLHDAVTRGILAMLNPLECKVSEVAGGEYGLHMVYPVEEDGKWQLILPERLIRAPVPHHQIEGVSVKNPTLWETTVATELWQSIPYSYTKKTNEEQAVNPEPYDPTRNYSKGQYCIYGPYVYQCINPSTGTPPTNLTVWAYVSKLSDFAGTGATETVTTTTIVSVPGKKLETLQAGVVMVRISVYNSLYMRVQTTTGKTGYVRIADCRQSSSSISGAYYESDPRDVRKQYFRISSVQVSSYDHTVTVEARHISYDLDGIQLRQCTFEETEPVLALAFMQTCFLGEDNVDSRVIATNATTDDGLISAAWSYGSPVAALLDPDGGYLNQIKGRLYRDDDDLIILRNDNTWDGVTIKYGVNLLGVTSTTDYADLVTRIVPIAKKADGTDYFLPEGYVDSQLVEYYAYIRYETLNVDAQVGQKVTKADGTEITMTAARVQEKMREEARKRFTDDRCDVPSVTIEVEFLLLGDTEEYAQYRDLQTINLYDIVRVWHPELGIDVNTQVTEYEWDAIRRRYNRITLGDPFEYGGGTVPGYQIGTRAIQERALSPGLRAKLGV